MTLCDSIFRASLHDLRVILMCVVNNPNSNLRHMCRSNPREITVKTKPSNNRQTIACAALAVVSIRDRVRLPVPHWQVSFRPHINSAPLILAAAQYSSPDRVRVLGLGLGTTTGS